MSNGDGPTSIGDWIKYLHAAEEDFRKGPSDPHYQEARDAVGLAARHIHALQVGQEMETANEPSSSAAGAATGEALDVLGAGTGEPIAGLGSFVQGKGFGAGAEQYREARNTLEAEHPTAANLGAGAGMLGQAALGAGQAVAARGMQAGVPLTIPQLAGTLARGGATAGAMGGLSGFSRGGEDPGDIGARFGQAGKDALYSALLGTLLTGVGMAGTRSHIENVADLTQKGTTRALTQQRLANARMAGERMVGRERPVAPQAATPTQADLGAELGTKGPSQPLHPDAVQALQDFEAGSLDEQGLRDALDFARGKPFEPLSSEAAPITEGPPGTGLRAGEKATEIPGTEGRGIEIRGTRTTPAPPTSPTILELQEGPQVNHWARKAIEEAGGSVGEGAPGPGVISPQIPSTMNDPRLLLQSAELAKMLGQGGPETDYYIQALRQALAGSVP